MSAKKKADDSLVDQFPGERVVSVRVRILEGENAGKYEEASITVVEMDMTQTARVLAMFAPLEQRLAGTGDLMRVIADHPAEAHGLLAINTGWPIERVAVLHFDSWFAVATAIWELNRSFFLLLRDRLVSAGRATATPAASGDGLMPSHSSAGTESQSPAASH